MLPQKKIFNISHIYGLSGDYMALLSNHGINNLSHTVLGCI